MTKKFSAFATFALAAYVCAAQAGAKRVFDGRCLEPNSTHAWSAERAFGRVRYLMKKRGESSGDPAVMPQPAECGYVIQAYLRYPPRDPDGHRAALARAKEIADRFLASPPADGSAWRAGSAFFELSARLGDARYRDAAVAWARGCAARSDGVDGAMLDFLDDASRVTGDGSFASAADKAASGADLRHDERIARLFRCGRTDEARRLLDGCEADLVVWADGTSTVHGRLWTPCAFEVRGATVPTDVGTARMMHAFSSAWQTTGDERCYMKAKALADSLTCQQRRAGGFLAEYTLEGGKVNDSVERLGFAALKLEEFAKAEAAAGRIAVPERIALWPDGKMPSKSVNQVYAPYIEWYVPKEKKTGLVLINCSGGGYNGSGVDGFEVNPVREYFLSRGVTVVTLCYRAPRPKGMPKHVTAWQDAQRAIRIVRSKAASRGCDPERIGFLGCSAGGHLTLLAALSSTVKSYGRIDALDDLPCHVNFAVPVYPAYALVPEMDKQDVEGCDDLSAEFDPALKFDANTPPMCFVHGDIDGWSPMASVRVYHRLRTMKVPAELHVFAMEGHCFMEHPIQGFPAANWKDRVWEWLFRMYLLDDSGKYRIKRW